MSADLLRRIRDLEEENRWLRERIAPSDMLPMHWGLSKAQTRLVVAVAQAPGCLKKDTVRLALGQIDRDVSDKVLEVQLVYARRLMAAVGVEILTVHGVGLTMSPESRAIVREALAAVRAGTVA